MPDAIPLLDPSWPDLPVATALPTLCAALAAGRNAVLVAPPGAGKTTLVPLVLMRASWLAGQRIVMLEPRRLATRAAAQRMAATLDEAAGATVGFRTRIESAVSAATRIEVVTEGLLVRRLLSDPGLEGVGCVILDEVHERAVEGDLALALCLDLQRMLRPELRLLAMSATADGARLAPLMDAEVVESSGRMFPVAVAHAARELAGPRDLPDAMARAVHASLAEDEGDILAFLPGMAEIRRAAGMLEGCGAAVLPLHGDLPPAEQERALRPAREGRRVVLATSIAETSLTVPGMRVVIDGGFRRAPVLDPATGLTRLVTRRISRAAAEQRAGRAGREAPGRAVRLWTEALHRGLAAHDAPEMAEAELSGLALDCAAWGTPPDALPFIDPPAPGRLSAARALLEELGALDASGIITPSGRRMAALGAHPRLAAMMLAAESPGQAALACALAAILEERDPLRRPGASREPPPADIALRIGALAHGSADADRGALARIGRAAAQYRRRLRVPQDAAPEGAAGPLLAAAFPDRIAQARSEPGSFRLSGGGGARLSRADPLARERLLAVAAIEQGTAARIALAAPLDPDALPAPVLARCTESVETALDPATGAVLARRRTRLGDLVLRDRTETVDSLDGARLLASALTAGSLRGLDWTDAARQLQARSAHMRAIEDDWPDLSDAALAAEAETWLTPALLGMTRLDDAQRLDITRLLRERLGHARVKRLDITLPPRLPLARGDATVDYAQDIPIASARAQAFYGLAETPRLAGGRVRLRLALLSPAGRPIAVTGDLAAFWSGGWADARKQMRGRYPRHDWPENPAHP